MSFKGYQFVNDEKPEKPIYPARVQLLIDEYLKAGHQLNKEINLRYDVETADIHEKIFEDRVRKRPDTLKITINAVYRIRDKNNQEWYMYSASKTCRNALDNLETWSWERYGYHRQPVVSLRWDEAKERSEPHVSSYTHGFELVWNKQEVAKLIKSSFLPCNDYYVGPQGISANDPVGDRCYQIFNLEDFLEGKFDDLMDMGRLGLSYKEQASLYMVEAGRKKERENREAALGMRQPQNKVYS